MPRKRGTRIPEPFLLTNEMKEWGIAERPTVDLIVETRKFVNHFRAKTGQNATKLDWRATWENWILNVNDYGKGGNRNAYPNKTTRTPNADALASYDQLE